MALPATLYGDYVSVTGGQSIQGIEVTDSAISFGVTDSESDYPIGTAIMFDSSNAIIVKLNSVQYFLINHNDIILVENAAAP